MILTQITHPSALVALVCAMLLTSTPAHAQPSAVLLKIDGISGESRNALLKDAIEVESYSLGVATAEGAVSDRGGAAGKPSLAPLSFVHRVDRASPALWQAAVRGKAVKSAALVVIAAGERGAVTLKITLSNVIVTAVQQAGGSDGAMETVSLGYSAIAIEYFEVTPDGMAKPVKMSFDAAAQR